MAGASVKIDTRRYSGGLAFFIRRVYIAFGSRHMFQRATELWCYAAEPKIGNVQFR
jgi:hypothetical protein